MILNKQVGVFLNLVHNRFKQYVTAIFLEQGYDISPEQFLVMDTLWDEGIMSQQKIADSIFKDKNSVVKLIDGLEKKKLIRRVANKQDRRQNLIEITPYAIKIKEEDLYKFIRVLSKMAENMNTDITLLKLAQAKNGDFTQSTNNDKEK